MLSLDPGHVDLTRLRGASVLDSHRHDALSRVLGVVTEAEVDGREGRATIRFSSRPDVEPYRRDVEAGVIRGVSIGYAVWSGLKAGAPTAPGPAPPPDGSPARSALWPCRQTPALP